MFPNEAKDLKWLADTKAFALNWSKDPSTKVGAQIVDNWGAPVSRGVNGFPRKIADDNRLNNRELKYKMIIHAEENAFIFAKGRELRYSKIYTWPFMPCPHCASLIIQHGIGEVISLHSDIERWQRDFQLSTQLLGEAGVLLALYEPEELK